MPAVNFNVQWPDGELVQYYSPSTVITQMLEVGKPYSIDGFSALVQASLVEASERVKNKFGYYCSAASAEQSKISKKVSELNNKHIEGDVIVIAFS